MRVVVVVAPNNPTTLLASKTKPICSSKLWSMLGWEQQIQTVIIIMVQCSNSWMEVVEIRIQQPLPTRVRLPKMAILSVKSKYSLMRIREWDRFSRCGKCIHPSKCSSSNLKHHRNSKVIHKRHNYRNRVTIFWILEDGVFQINTSKFSFPPPFLFFII